MAVPTSTTAAVAAATAAATAASTGPPSGNQNMFLGYSSTRMHWSPNKHELLAHQAKLSQHLSEIQATAEGPKPDIIILLKDQNVVHLHSEIGLAHSGYLRKRYANELWMQHRQPAISVMDFIDFDPDAVRRMVNFFYSGVLPCSMAEAPELFELAIKFQVPSVKAMIEKYVVQKAAELGNLMDCWNITCNKNSEFSNRARDIVLSYVIQNLEQVFQLFK
ncbi:unnamed protein product [Gongylonema pulchrum]|uniref:BTB domain-containing protein n=1 Tax=Gongylonema pulchrum TaxID=637853 RepID=A0A183E8P4_9BILA|nr:unnamed protein product [Gongylonema pulchrum]